MGFVVFLFLFNIFNLQRFLSFLDDLLKERHIFIYCGVIFQRLVYLGFFAGIVQVGLRGSVGRETFIYHFNSFSMRWGVDWMGEKGNLVVLGKDCWLWIVDGWGSGVVGWLVVGYCRLLVVSDSGLWDDGLLDGWDEGFGNDCWLGNLDDWGVSNSLGVNLIGIR